MKHLVLCALVGCWTEPEAPTCALAHQLNEINTPTIEGTPWLSNDRLELVFTQFDTGRNKFLLVHAERASPADPFGNFQPLAEPPGQMLNATFDPWLAPHKQVLRFVVGNGNTGGNIYEAMRDDSQPGRYATATAVQVFTNLTAPGPGVLRPTFTDDDREIAFVVPKFDAADPDKGDLAIARRDEPTQDFHLPIQPLAVSTPTTTEKGAMILGDGQTLVYHVGDIVNGELPRIYRAEREGNDFVHGALVTELLGQDKDDDENPYLAPDRKTWLFSRDTRSGTYDDLWTYCE